MSSQVYTGILQSEIPMGGMGRSLTAEERRKLSRYGVPCSKKHIVVRLDAASPTLGRLYEPSSAVELHAPLDIIIS